MTDCGPPVGSILFLRPEDVDRNVENGFYARVDSLSDSGVVVMAVDSDGPTEPVTVDGRVALTRVVPTGELAGSQLSASLRRGVACLVNETVCFGQVVSTTVAQVQVNLSSGAAWIDEDKVLGVVHPLLAILLYGAALPSGVWTGAKVAEASDRVCTALSAEVGKLGRLPTANELLDALAAGLSDGVSAVGLRQWVDARTGLLQVTSVDHAIRYTYYAAGGRPVPMLIRWSVGGSIAADPACVLKASPGEGVSAAVVAKRQCRRPFLGSETSYDDAAAEHHQAVGADDQAPGDDGEEEKETDVADAEPAPVRVNRTCRMSAPAAGRRAQLGITEDEGRLLERLARDPEGYRLYMKLRHASPEVAVSAEVGRGQSKQAFRPDDAQVMINKGFRSSHLQGTSPVEFVQRMMSPSAVPFTTHPAVLMRLFEYAFGLRGLSVMHLVALTLKERMRAQREQAVNYNDLSGAVKLPVAKVPMSWNDLQDGVNGLVSFSNAFCDDTTRQLAVAVSMFVSEMRALGLWPENRLYALEYWINAQLGEYREMMLADARYGIDSRGEVAKRFSPHNPHLVITMIANLTPAPARTPAAGDRVPDRQPTRSAGQGAQVPRAIPADVVAAIPHRDGRELCLKYVSKKGCKDGYGGKCSFSDRGHFDDVVLPPVVRAYVITKFGGLSAAVGKK